MGTLIAWVLLGAIFVIIGVTVSKTQSERLPTVAAWSKRIGSTLGALTVIFAITSTSFVWVPDGKFGTVFKIYGGTSLQNGKIIATNGENGPQAGILAPGFHPAFLINVLNDVDTETPQTHIPQGFVGMLSAKDGAPFRAGQAFADPFPTTLGYDMLDAETFLKNGGQRGPQLTVLTPGTYRLNPYLWEVETVPVYEVQAGSVGVVKSNIYADVDFGTLKAKKPDSCEVIQATTSGRIDAPLVPVGCIGVWEKSLPPGKYYFNPQAFTITTIDTKAQVWNYAGGYTKANISLTVDASGGITQNRTETEVPYDINRDADRAVFVKMEGWDVPLELRVVAQVSPENAACVVAGIGGLKEVEDRVLTPSIRAITRDVAGGTYTVEEPKLDMNGQPIIDENGQPIIVSVNRLTKVLDLINQRPLIEREIELRIKPEGDKSCVTIREVRLGEPAIPPELLVAVRREQLATQLAEAFIQEQAAQEERIATEKSKATADQQTTLVTAEIGVQASQQNALAAANQGAGERDKLLAIAEGQRAQTEILGVEGTIQLRQYELLLDRVFGFAERNPDVITNMLANAHKFVPNIMVGGSENGSGMMSALLGQMLESGGIPVSIASQSEQ